MKTIEELQSEKKVCKERLENLWEQREEISIQIEETKSQIREIETTISNYEKCQKTEEENNYRKAILEWLTGQSETFYNIGNYSGVVCPSLGIFEYKGEKPKGTQEEITILLKQKNIKMFTFSTYFVPCGPWGDDIISINFYEKL